MTLNYNSYSIKRILGYNLITVRKLIIICLGLLFPHNLQYTRIGPLGMIFYNFKQSDQTTT